MTKPAGKREIVQGPTSGLELPGGRVKTPECCGEPMQDDGDCGQGCCDDFRCAKCGRLVRVEWSD